MRQTPQPKSVSMKSMTTASVLWRRMRKAREGMLYAQGTKKLSKWSEMGREKGLALYVHSHRGQRNF